jgi:hypothetical protein
MTETYVRQLYIKAVRDHAPGKFDMFNQHGNPICNYIGCRKNTKLREFASGLWCKKHIGDIQYIRGRINHTGTEDELKARIEEFEIRKNTDIGHYYYAHSMEIKK